MPITVLMNAGPWLPVPPGGYGGIENVVATLVPELRRRGVRVVLCAAGGSTLEADRVVTTLPEPRFPDIAAPYNQAMGIAHAHMAAVLRELEDDDAIDLVHDHLEVVGPAVLAAADWAPPVLQTLHWDLRKHPDFYRSFDGGDRVWFSGVSHVQIARAPIELERRTVGVVPLGIDVDAVPFRAEKGERCLALARVCHDKGQDVAARACRSAGVPLDIAGPVGAAAGPRGLTAAMVDRPAADVRFYLEHVRPLEDGDRVRWIGSLEGAAKLDVLARARALVFPIRWEEPGATAVVEAMACGTPVVGMRRGVLPLLVEHGRTGFLADEEDELAGYLRRVDELDPHACRRVAEERFSAGAMADAYLELYDEVLTRSASAARPARRVAGAAR
jgi:glycosyltransferase involved in cell wall biosynthesis